ncbi:hypothetical protein [Micromonospora coerulea]
MPGPLGGPAEHRRGRIDGDDRGWETGREAYRPLLRPADGG